MISCSDPGAVPLAREQRETGGVLAADVVGYSRLMGRDEGRHVGVPTQEPL